MMADEALTRREILSLIARVAAFSAMSYFTMKWLMDAIDPTRKQQLLAKEKAQKLLKSLGVPSNIELNNHEMMVASNLVEPKSIQVSWDDVAGLEAVIEELKESVILPIKERDLFSHSQLTRAPKGVLLHGPPGCGKTMIAKATAKEAGARFVNLDVSQITDKWYGESQKLATAIFTLAAKLSPCIIFIDEIDSLLRIRDAHDHEATAMIKAQFMQMWDGLETNQNATVVVMGATNRPKDVDKAILRRMPATFHVGLPDVHQRKSILKRILEMESVGEDIDYARLAKLTDGFSGSDLREACRTASVYRMRELMALKAKDEHCQPELREIANEDMLKAVAKLKESKVHCGATAAHFASASLD